MLFQIMNRDSLICIYVTFGFLLFDYIVIIYQNSKF